MSSKKVAEWSSILILGHPADKKKVPVRLVTAVTVLFLIIAGLPLSDVYNNIASADGNPYAPVGTIVVNSNNAEATFLLSGPTNTFGSVNSGLTWSNTNAEVGSYTITYSPITGYYTPSSSSQTIVNGGDTITFTGTYNPIVGTITVTTNNAASTFTVTGPATYSGSGTTWTQTNAPVGTYTLTFNSVTGYSTPASSSQTIVNGGDTIAFIGTYAPLGTITVSTNNVAATFTVTGPATYSGSGTSFSQTNAPAGTYTITYDPVTGYSTPASSSQTIVNGGDTIAFTGTYNPLGTITVSTNNAASTFNITGPATYSGSGTSWSQANAPAGAYTITYDPVTGYSTPASDTKTFVNSGETIAFAGTYNAASGTISVTTDNSGSTFTISGPATYSGSGLSWSQPNAPVGTYTITYGSITGYNTPVSSSQTIVNNGDTISFTGTYTAMTVITVTLSASADTNIDQKYPSINYGSLANMNVQSQTSNKHMRSLIRFDTSSIPTGSSIISATLSIYAYMPASSRTYDVYKTTTSWVESDVTWNTQPSVASTTTWSTNTPSTANWMGWTVTPDVQAWVNGNSNYGWQIRDQVNDASYQRTTQFRSKDASSYASQKPKLEIQYWG
jgi:hypothetical protein